MSKYIYICVNDIIINMNNKRPIHTTLSKECRDWLHKVSEESKKHEGEFIEDALNFYKTNKTILEEYKQARFFIKEMIENELVEDFNKAKPLLKRLIGEEINERK